MIAVARLLLPAAAWFCEEVEAELLAIRYGRRDDQGDVLVDAALEGDAGRRIDLAGTQDLFAEHHRS